METSLSFDIELSNPLIPSLLNEIHKKTNAIEAHLEVDHQSSKHQPKK